MTDDALRIVELRAQNVKKLRAVHIRPDADGGMVVLAGRNGAGKSSVLDAIAMALGGRDQIPSEPIRRGADHAEVVVDLGDLIVRRTFTPAGGGALTVSNKDGARFTSPQTMLDKLVGKLTFDPLAFAREKPAQQGEILRGLVGLDLGAIDARREQTFQKRTEVNRNAKALASRVEAMPKHDDAPADPVDVAELTEQLQAANATNAEHAGTWAAVQKAANQRESREHMAAETHRRIEELQKVLAQQEQEAADAAEKAAFLQRKAENCVEVETAPIIAQIRDAETTNRKVRENHERQHLAVQQAEAEAESRKLTEEIAQLDKDRAEAIAAAPMPVEGLGFDGSGHVTLGGIPLEQASAGERLRVSVAIGLAMNPKLRVLLIRDASLLDGESMRLVADMARAAGSQLWVEVIEAGDRATVVIEDGEVVGQTAEAAT